MHTCSDTIPQSHDNLNILWSQLMDILCWIGKGRQFGTVKMNWRRFLTPAQLYAT